MIGPASVQGLDLHSARAHKVLLTTSRTAGCHSGRIRSPQVGCKWQERLRTAARTIDSFLK